MGKHINTEKFLSHVEIIIYIFFQEMVIYIYIHIFLRDGGEFYFCFYIWVYEKVSAIFFSMGHWTSVFLSTFFSIKT